MPTLARASVPMPPGSVWLAAPVGANLSHRRCLAAGVTAALWADRDRTLTKRWAAELHGAGHQAIHHGIQHDPGGRLRAVTLFDAAGAREPWGLAWPEPATISCRDRRIVAVLEALGVHVTGHRPTLPIVEHDG